MPPRKYDHVADDDTLNALRHLRGAWRGWTRTPEGEVKVQTTDGVVVRLAPDACTMEAGFAVRRIAASFDRDARPVPPVKGFGDGSNEVVVFKGESWLTPITAAGAANAQFRGQGLLVTHGVPGERPEGAIAACTTTDAVLVASAHGTGWLVRLGATPDALDVLTDREAIAAFLTARGYQPL